MGLFYFIESLDFLMRKKVIGLLVRYFKHRFGRKSESGLFPETPQKRSFLSPFFIRIRRRTPVSGAPFGMYFRHLPRT